MIPYGRQSISSDDIQSVIEVLESDWLTQGPMVEKFEDAVAKYCGARYAVAVSNATAALHIGAKALGLKAGDTLWTSPNTFVATSNAALYNDGIPQFVDIDSHTWNISTDALEKKLKGATKLPKIVAPVHFGGQSCDMKSIKALSDRYRFQIMEDASHAAGGQYLNKPVGSCEFSDLCVFSFHPVKIVTTGEGGMILTNRKDLYESLLRLRTHGITREPAQMTKPPEGPWYYEQIELGYNYRLSDIQCVLGLSQFKRIDQFVERRRELAARYQKLLQGLPIMWQTGPGDSRSSYHLFVIVLDPKWHRHRKQIFEQLRENGIGVNVHYLPVYRQPYYSKFDYSPNEFVNSETYYSGCLTLPLYPGLTDTQQDYVVKTLGQVIREIKL